MTSYREITRAQLLDDTERILNAVVQEGLSAAIVDADRQVLAWLVPPREADRQAAHRGRRQPDAPDEPPVREIELDAQEPRPVMSEPLRRLLAASGMSPTDAAARRKARSNNRAADADYLARQRLHQRPGPGEQGIGR